jgi:hypothetical protein
LKKQKATSKTTDLEYLLIEKTFSARDGLLSIKASVFI